VDRDVLPLFHRLLRCFEQRSGVPVLLNTSFNLNGEPIVCTFRDALRTFYATAIDTLAAGNYIIRKQGDKPDA
jgi:carbamoyltransferase